MKTLIRINISDESIISYELETCVYDGYDYELNIYTDGTLSVDELLKNREMIEQQIEENNNFLEINKNDKMIQNIKVDSFEQLMGSIDSVCVGVGNDPYSQDFEYVELDPKEEQRIIDEYLEEHSELKDYILLINETITDDTDVEKLKDKYKDYKGALVLASGSFEPISLEKATAKDNIDKLVDNIKMLGLSPLEQTILAYDIVRYKPYQHEGKGQSASSSRDILQALEGDQIVCLGYANLLDKILNRLGINTTVLLLEGIKKDDQGHARNAVLLKDDKYNVNGIFILDATIDSREKDDKYNYLYDYKAFLKKKKQMSRYDASMQVEDASLGFLNNHTIDDTTELFRLNSLNPLHVLSSSEQSKKDYWGAKKFLKTCLDLVCPEKVTPSDTPIYRMDLYKEHEEEIKELFNNDIPIHVFVKALLNVRFIENKIDPNNYPFEIKMIANNLDDFGFNVDVDYLTHYVSQADRLLITLFDGDPEFKPDRTPADGMKAFIYDVLADLKQTERDHTYKVVDSIKLYNNGKKKDK